jgi:PBP1b-binding outer membrane lipoprotein LpoB
MKKLFSLGVVVVAGALFLNGCVASIGNQESAHGRATLGQQLVDLQKAKDAGAISDAEYQTQKSKLLNAK